MGQRWYQISQPVYNSIDMEHCLVQEARLAKEIGDVSIISTCPQRSLCMLLGHSVLLHESFQSCILLDRAFCVAHHALLNVEFVCNCKLAAGIDLRALHWNASLMRLTFSSEVRVFPGDLTHNRLPVVLSVLSQN
jgi:hypothetical protein